MHTFLIIGLATGTVVLFAVGFLSVLHDLLARFSQPLALTLEDPEDIEHNPQSAVPLRWSAKDVRA